MCRTLVRDLFEANLVTRGSTGTSSLTAASRVSSFCYAPDACCASATRRSGSQRRTPQQSPSAPQAPPLSAHAPHVVSDRHRSPGQQEWPHALHAANVALQTTVLQGSGLQVSELGSHRSPLQQSPSLPQALVAVPHAWQLPVVAQIKPVQQLLPKASLKSAIESGVGVT